MKLKALALAIGTSAIGLISSSAFSYPCANANFWIAHCHVRDSKSDILLSFAEGDRVSTPGRTCNSAGHFRSGFVRVSLPAQNSSANQNFPSFFAFTYNKLTTNQFRSIDGSMVDSFSQAQESDALVEYRNNQAHVRFTATMIDPKSGASDVRQIDQTFTCTLSPGDGQTE